MTKNFILSSIFLLNYCVTLTAQNYKPILEEGAQWNEGFYFESSDNNMIIVGADSTILDITYKKILNQFGGILTLLREDTIERKVYRLKSNKPFEEELLYDFSLQVGDTFDNLRLDSITDKLMFPFAEVIFLRLTNDAYSIFRTLVLRHTFLLVG